MTASLSERAFTTGTSKRARSSTFETNTLVFYQKVESGNQKIEKLFGEVGRQQFWGSRQRFSTARQRKMIFFAADCADYTEK
jgi:hypothetical protein